MKSRLSGFSFLVLVCLLLTLNPFMLDTNTEQLRMPSAAAHLFSYSITNLTQGQAVNVTIKLPNQPQQD